MDKKLTDSEIVKALDNIQNHKWIFAKADNGDFIRIGDVADLINRQKAKIIKLENKNSKVRNERNRARAEAYKEFAERLKEAPIKCALPLSGLSTKDEIEDYFNDIMLQVRDVIDNLKKELVGEQNG